MDKIEKDLAGFPLTRCFDLKRAAEYAFANAQKGDVVLLSPACSSFDQFKSFEHRGQVFKQLINALVFAARTDGKN